MKRVLLLLPTTSYRNDAFLAAAKRLSVEVVAAANYCHQLAPTWGMAPLMALHFDRPEQAADIVLREIKGDLNAVLAVDDTGVELAALLAERLGLAGNPVAAVRFTRDKLAFRHLLREHGFLCPQFHPLAAGEDSRNLAAELQFPVVVKARRLSGSRGVIRADDSAALVRAVNRVRAIQAKSDRDAQALGLLIEDFIPGREYALEGLLVRTELTTLALFDKPDPLDGPYFEETLYITPSRLPAALQDGIQREVARACRAAGLATGPIHAEMRVNDRGIWLLEVAARSIGGLCGRVLNHRLGMSLEELILRHALNTPLPTSTHSDASGVMMIPIPERGIFRGGTGLMAARAVAGVSDIRITAQPGQMVAPPPEGEGYLGFIFSGAAVPEAAEAALRAAHAELAFDIQADLPVVRPCTQ